MDESPPLAEPPARLYVMRRQRKPEYWKFVKLAPKTEHMHLPDEELRNEHADFAYCERCKITIYFTTGNHDVGRHMAFRHLDLLLKYVKEQEDEANRALSCARIDPSSRASKRQKVQVSLAEQMELSNLVAFWVAQSMRPISIVEDPGLRRVFQRINEISGVDLKFPGTTDVRRDIQAIAEDLRASLRQKLQDECDFYSLTTDIWTDRAMRAYQALTVHYVDENFELFSWVLGVERFPGKHDGKRVASAIGKSLGKWPLEKASCSMLLRDGAKNAVVASNELGLPCMSCMSHCVHLVVSAATSRNPKRISRDTRTTRQPAPAAAPATAGTSRLPVSPISPFEDEDEEITDADAILELDGGREAVERLREEACEDALAFARECGDEDLRDALGDMREIIAVFRTIAVYLRRSAKGRECYERLQVERCGSTKHIPLDSPTRWNSTWMMLKTCVEHQQDVERFIGYLATTGKADFTDVRLPTPTLADWLSIKCIQKLLEGLAVVNEFFGGDKYPTLVETLPFLRMIKADLQCETVLDEYLAGVTYDAYVPQVAAHMHKVRRALLALFTKRFSGLDAVLRWTPLLDPRQPRKMAYLLPHERDLAREELITAMVEMGGGEPPLTPPPGHPTFLSPQRRPVRPIDRLRDRMFGDDEDDDDEAPNTNHNEELRIMYTNEVTTYFNACKTIKNRKDIVPLAWWKANVHLFPNVGKLARKWFGCVASSVPSERAFSTGGNIVSVKRCSLDPDLVDDLIFIAKNSDGILKKEQH